MNVATVILVVAVVVEAVVCAVLAKRIRELWERVAEIEQTLEDAWVVVIPHHSVEEWTWPSRN